MNKLKALFSALCISLLLSSCAGSYRAIQPASLSYMASPTSNNDVELGYRYNILTDKKNKKFANREEKKKIHLIAVQITNHSNKTLTFGDDVLLYSNGQPVMPLSKTSSFRLLKQNPAFFLFHLFSTNLIYLYPPELFVPVGLLLGPGVAFSNMSKANSNNKKFLKELTENDLHNRPIAPGETVYGLMAVRNFSFSPLEVRLKKPKNLEVNDEYYIEQFN